MIKKEGEIMQKRILTIQDISCLGQCSLTVALPIISACGVETCVLPSAVLSTHTGGFTGFTFRDLTEDMPLIEKHWRRERIKYDCIYTGYLGSEKQIEYVKSIFSSCLRKSGVKVVDPAFADNGKLYVGFDENYVEAMKELCKVADVLIPNLTEACFLTGTAYREKYREAYIDGILKKLSEFGASTVVLKGIGYEEGKTGVVVMRNGKKSYYEHVKLENSCHGTGDIYSSAFVGALMNEKAPFDAAKIAADFTVRCIENTQKDPKHWYGARFESVLPELIEKMK